MKSDVSDYMKLLQLVYDDACSKCTADVSDVRDLAYARSRAEQEGVSFFTITLPLFARDFERALDDGHISPALFRNYRKKGAIPAFLSGILGNLFSVETGELNESLKNRVNSSNRNWFGECSTLVESVRQISRLFAKIELPCAPFRERAALANFVTVEDELSSFAVSYRQYDDFCRVAFLLWNDLGATFSSADITPKHGPGQTAERISGNRKFVHRTWHDRLEPYFPLLSNGYPLGAFDSKELREVTFVQPDEELPVRVVLVPKTLKAPRVIALEPVCMQFTQQGIRDWLYGRLESYPFTAGHINFRDQSVNQGLAMSSSEDGKLATLDLKDASDRVPWSIARLMFIWNDDLLSSIDACRSRTAEMPDGTRISLDKFASMGSALCFPVEAMYFYTIVVLALLDSRKLSYTERNALKVISSVYIYGDDLVVPADEAVLITSYLHKYNCRVNVHKSFGNGRFRESCGRDAFAGYDVTPTYVRQPCPRDKQSSVQLVSWSSMANQFYRKGYWKTAQYVHNVCERLLGYYPYAPTNSSVLGRNSFLYSYTATGWCDDRQAPRMRAFVVKPTRRTDVLEGYGALAKCLTAEQPIEDAFHLGSSVLRGTVTLKRRWVQPYI